MMDLEHLVQKERKLFTTVAVAKGWKENWKIKKPLQLIKVHKIYKDLSLYWYFKNCHGKLLWHQFITLKINKGTEPSSYSVFSLWAMFREK